MSLEEPATLFDVSRPHDLPSNSSESAPAKYKLKPRHMVTGVDLPKNKTAKIGIPEKDKKAAAEKKAAEEKANRSKKDGDRWA